jgi:predicted amidohydrolase YtcJ
VRGGGLRGLTLTRAEPVKAAPSVPVVAIVGASVFDGTGAAPVVETVLIKGDRIVAVGTDVKIPSDARIINAKGKALTPLL